jgi:hypothetical protein
MNMVAIQPKVPGFKPGRKQFNFKADKNPQQDFLQRGSKVVGHMS